MEYQRKAHLMLEKCFEWKYEVPHLEIYHIYHFINLFILFIVSEKTLSSEVSATLGTL